MHDSKSGTGLCVHMRVLAIACVHRYMCYCIIIMIIYCQNLDQFQYYNTILPRNQCQLNYLHLVHKQYCLRLKLH